MTKTLQDMIASAYDLHVHVGPEVIPRKYTAQSLWEEERGKLAGCVLKNHFYPSIPCQTAQEAGELKLFASVVLNHFVGGLNPHAVWGAAMAAPSPLFVWFPTLHTEQFLRNSAWEIPKEWVGRPDFRSRKSDSIAPVLVSDGADLCEDVYPVLRAIAESGSVLCTGHISWRESVLLARAGRDLGVRKIIVTHPIYQKIAMPIDVQKELAAAGCMIEHCYSMHSIDGVAISQIARQIREVGPEHIVLSSDVGQTFSPSPSEALAAFSALLMEEGIGLDALRLMLCDNPRRVLEH